MQIFMLILAVTWLLLAYFTFYNASDTRTYIAGWSALVITNIHLVGSYIITALGG
jgi:hypothetical protein